MAWNEPGNGKNPWDGGRGQEGPPDLDKIVREWQKRLNSMFGGKGGKGGGSGPSAGMNKSLLIVLAALLIGAWCFTGLYRVDDAERGVELRFGRYVGTTQPGLRWHMPYPIETVELVNVKEVNRFSQQTRMLTADENIVVVDLAVQFRKADPVSYLFQVRDADATLSDVSESAIREVIGKSPMDFVLLEGRAEISENTRKVIQEALDAYGAGIVVTTVNLQDVNFPGQVEAAVQDAIKAREDKERLAFEAQSYSNDILPRARGEASRRLQDSLAYKERVIADSEGEASRFEQLLVEYKKAPGVTRERLYIEAIEEVYSGSNKVLLDVEGSGNLLYLPVDKLIEQQRSSTATGSSRATPGGLAPASNSTLRDDPRSRGSR